MILCDEPTTALDVTIQDQILKLLRLSARSFGDECGVRHPRPRRWWPRRAEQRRGDVRRAGRRDGQVDDVSASHATRTRWGLLRVGARLRPGRDAARLIPGVPPDLSAPPRAAVPRPLLVRAGRLPGRAAPPVRRSGAAGRRPASIPTGARACVAGAGDRGWLRRRCSSGADPRMRDRRRGRLRGAACAGSAPRGAAGGGRGGPADLPGEALGLVGESGSGKSTLARAIVGLQSRPSARSVRGPGLPARQRSRPAASRPDRLPGPLLVAQPADDRGDRRSASCCGCTPSCPGPGRRSAAGSWSTWSASARRRWTRTLDSSPAASGSGWRSPARWPWSPSCWSPTSRCRRSMCRCRRRCSTCSTNCARSSG